MTISLGPQTIMKWYGKSKNDWNVGVKCYAKWAWCETEWIGHELLMDSEMLTMSVFPVSLRILGKL